MNGRKRPINRTHNSLEIVIGTALIRNERESEQANGGGEKGDAIDRLMERSCVRGGAKRFARADIARAARGERMALSEHAGFASGIYT